MKSKVFFLSFFLSIVFSGIQAQNKNSNTDWFMKAKYGLFVHFLPSGNDFQKCINEFDVNGFARDCEEAGAGYVMFTIGQNSGFYNAPNNTYDKFTGFKTGERCSKRDLPMELANALNKKGIKLMLYVSGDAPCDDSLIAKKLGAQDFVRNENGENWVYNDTLVKRWSEVIREWSDRYDSLVAGWWVDGCYTKSGFTNGYGKILTRALKHGNPKSIVAINSGLNYNKTCDSQDFLAGEKGTLLGAVCPGRLKDGIQWHELSYLGKGWGQGNPSCTGQQLIDYLKTNIIPNGGVLTIDIRLNNDYIGSRIHATHLTLLKEVKKAIR